MTVTPPHVAAYGPSPAILLTNDDGVHPSKALVLTLAKHLCANGHNIVVLAPGRNNSACSQRVSLATDLTLRRHLDYESQYTPANGGSLRVYSIDQGSPADCICVAIEPKTGLLAQLGMWPQLTVSGINNGQNLGTDVIYSGTFAGARQAALYGIPAIATSFDMFHPDRENPKHIEAILKSVNATVDITQAALKILPEEPIDVGRCFPTALKRDTSSDEEFLQKAFARGDLVLNLNVPVDWDGNFRFTSLDNVLYREVAVLPYLPSGVKDASDESITIQMGGKKAEHLFPNSDSHTIRTSKTASVSAVSTWPLSHPFALSQRLFETAAKSQWFPVQRIPYEAIEM